nr:hypothetical protein [uncultured Acetatifactor sp.]
MEVRNVQAVVLGQDGADRLAEKGYIAVRNWLKGSGTLSCPRETLLRN